MIAFLSALCEGLRQGDSLALATVMHQEGSAPRGAGSRMLARMAPTGGEHAAPVAELVAGTVGGGLAEAQTLTACARSLAAGQGCVLHFDLSGAMAAQAEMICGGRVQVLIEVIPPAELPLWERVLASVHQEGGVLFVPLVMDIPAAPSFVAGGACYGAPLAHPLPPTVHSLKHPTLLDMEGQSYFVQAMLPPLRLILVGGGHVSRPTAHVAALAGYDVLVLDDRPEFAHAQRFPEARTLLAQPAFAHCFAHLPFSPNPRTGIVIVTRGHMHDASVLVQALATKAGYIGMIGSKRKRDSLYAALREQGFTDADIARVHCPVGLPIQAETPEEIAISIVAECIQYFAAQGGG